MSIADTEFGEMADIINTKRNKDKLPTSIYVFGNEKGGAGKTTLASHFAVVLVRRGLRVGVLDCDIRQRAFEKFWIARDTTAKRMNTNPPTPIYQSLGTSEENADLHLASAVAEFQREGMDAIIIDTPGNDTQLSRGAHVLADILVTPLNDSFVDINMLAQVSMPGFHISKPGAYAELVWRCRKIRASRKNSKPVDWIVIRNRIPHINTSNSDQVMRVLEMLSHRLGYRMVNGLSDRAVYKELYIHGLTLLDLHYPEGVKITTSHIAGRQELRDVLSTIGRVDWAMRKTL